MKKVGELIRESIEAMESNVLEQAFATACAALKITLKNSLQRENLNNGDYYNFVQTHWRLLAFMSFQQALPLSLDVDFKLKLVVHGFNISGAEELVLHLVRQTAILDRTPAEFKFYRGVSFEIHNNQVFVPAALIYGIVCLVIFQPANKNESIPEKFWINVSDFKMFVSEFWGRIDLAERIMKFYGK